MAQRVTIELVDDIDGQVATSTVSFGLDGTSYEIDLSDANAAALRSALAPYIGHARKVSARSGRASAGVTRLGPSPREIRDWARGQGISLPERGRIPAGVREQFDAAH